jgi:hypothetical protein
MISRSESHAAIDQLFPDVKRLSFSEALKASSDFLPRSSTLTTAGNASTEIDQLLAQLDSVHQLGQSPLVAVSGLLNAGKSSLIASFLSPANRNRVLVGSGNQQGTHRFVIWLPASWQQQPQVWRRWLEQLRSTFGRAAEWLSTEPSIAYAQYNGQSYPELSTERSDSVTIPALSAKSDELATGDCVEFKSLEVPLIATDAALDLLGVGLIECPDIQTGILGSGSSNPWEDSGLPEYRRQILARAARLCSAFIVVTKLRDLHDQQTDRLLTTLKEAMPGLPRILAINLIRRRYLPSEILNESQGIMDRFGIDRLYAAYDFRGEQLRERLPPIPEEFASIASRGEVVTHPIFFRLDRVALSDTTPRPAPEDYLLRLGKQLNQSEMFQAWQNSLIGQLRNLVVAGKDTLVSVTSWQEKMQDDLRQEVAEAILGLIGKRDDHGEVAVVRLQTSKQIIGQINASLHRTSPWWSWPSLMVDKTVAWTKDSVSNAAKNLMPMTSIQQSLKGVKDWFRQSDRSQIMTADRLRKELRSRLPEKAWQTWSDEEWLGVCQRILDRFQNENQTLLPIEQLDQWSKSVWDNMPLSKRLTTGLVPVASVFAPLAAVLLIPIDLGGSTVLVFASLKELVAAAGIAGAWAAISGSPTPAVAEEEAAWQQYGDLVAITLDELGLPRPAVTSKVPRLRIGRNVRDLPASRLPGRTRENATHLPIWKVRAEFLRQIELLENVVSARQ